MTRAAIMQPTYLPWIGYFALMESVDHFVLLDTVAFDKRSWQQRNRIKTADGAAWLTLPVRSKGKSGQLISDVVIEEPDRALARHRASIEHAYAKAPHFGDCAPALFEAFAAPPMQLCELTIRLIALLRGMLDIETPLCRASALEVDGDRAGRLAGLCAALDADEYVSPPAAAAYLEKERAAFDEARISISYFDYPHPVYPQLHGEFLSHMSAIDLLFNAGPEAGRIMRRALAGPETADEGRSAREGADAA